jgi:leucyl aminopeptidase
MQLQCQHQLIDVNPEYCIIIGFFSNTTLTPFGKSLDQQSRGYLTRLLKRTALNKPNGCETLFLPELPQITSSILLVACGDQSRLDERAFRKILIKTAVALQSIPTTKSIYCELTALPVINHDEAWKTRQATAYLASSYYRFTAYKTSQKPLAIPEKIVFQSIDTANLQAQALLDGLTLLKDLGNLPANICTPTYLAEQSLKLNQKFNHLHVEVLDEKLMTELGMGALLAVNQGSNQPAKFICMHYQGGHKSQKPYVFIGKGITFDTGGISLKPPPAMDEMKYDMCGGATVIALLHTAAQLQLPLNIIGLVPTAENMPSGKATRPGDIVKSLSGKTIEILNTDAEGRLILCDALTYAEQFNPELVIDIATLTGSVILTFGHVATAVMGNNSMLIQELLAAAKESGERLWELPLWEEYQEMLTSNFADLPNIHNDNYAKAIIAGCFLSRFAEKFPWAHLDIAGTASLSGKDKGATGRPLPLLVEFLLKKVKK